MSDIDLDIIRSASRLSLLLPGSIRKLEHSFAVNVIYAARFFDMGSDAVVDNCFVQQDKIDFLF